VWKQPGSERFRDEMFERMPEGVGAEHCGEERGETTRALAAPMVA